MTEELVADVADEKVEFPADFEPFKTEILKLAKQAHDTDNFRIAEDGYAENVSEENYKPNANFAKMNFRNYGTRSRLSRAMKLVLIRMS